MIKNDDCNFLVFLDTSILLLPLQYNQIDINLFKKILIPFLKNIVITDTVLKEFDKNWTSVREREKKSILDQIVTIENNLSTITEISKVVKVPSSLRTHAEKSAKDWIIAIKDKIKTEAQAFDEKSSLIKNQLDDFIKGTSVYDEIPFSEKLKIYKEGEFRYRNEIAPGFKDAGKKGLAKYNDLIIWKEILRASAIKSKDQLFLDGIILLSNDTKQDWRSPEALISLKDEFEENANNDFRIYSLLEFQAEFKDVIELNEHETVSITEAMRFSKEKYEFIEIKNKFNELINKGINIDTIDACLSPEQLNEFFSNFSQHPESLKYIPLEFLGLTPRSRNCLKNSGIDNIWDFQKLSIEEIVATRNFGKNSLNEIKSKLKMFIDYIELGYPLKV